MPSPDPGDPKSPKPEPATTERQGERSPHYDIVPETQGGGEEDDHPKSTPGKSQEECEREEPVAREEEVRHAAANRGCKLQ